LDPRVSISVLVDYMLAETAGGRRAVLKAAKSSLGRTYFAPYYGAARKAIRDYHSGRSSALTEEIGRIKAQLHAPRKPQHAALLLNNLRALSDYREHFADVSLRHTSKRFSGVPVQGIVITCEPTLSGMLSHGRKENAANVIVEFGEEAPNQEAANYTTELIFRASGLTFETPPAGAQLWHPGSGSEWSLKKSMARTWHVIEAACEEIAARWPGI
jgi:hypothetical protein